MKLRLATIYIQSFIKISSDIQNIMGGGFREYKNAQSMNIA
jgi:hypothetical protein